MAAPRNVYMVNYFPITNGGYGMWENYNGPQYQADMVTAQSLGFNTIRVNLAAYTNVFNFPTPTSGQLANLTDFYNRAKTVGIKLHLALFDYWGSYGQISGSNTWISTMLGALPDITAIQCIELQNETKYGSTTTYSGGFDAGWPSGTTQYTQLGQVAVVWAQQIIPHIRSVLPGAPVAPSTTTYDGYTDFSTIVNALSGTASAPDWYEWHCYATLSNIGPALKSIIALADDPANIFIGETGYNSAASGSITAIQGQQYEADYLQAQRWWCQQLGLPEPSPWILFDMNPSAQFSSGQTYGLIDVNGNLKTAALLYQTIPLGATIPSLAMNTSTKVGFADANGNVLPDRVLVYKGNNGQQPITASIDSTVTYEGQPTVLLTGSSATLNTDNPPSLEYRPITWPLISTGQSYTFTVALRATGSYGTPNLVISWYDSNLSYISGTNGSTLTLTSTFTTASLTSIAPANAAYAYLFVRVGYNAGNIWVGGAQWTISNAARMLSVGGHWQRVSH